MDCAEVAGEKYTDGGQLANGRRPQVLPSQTDAVCWAGSAARAPALMKAASYVGKPRRPSAFPHSAYFLLLIPE